MDSSQYFNIFFLNTLSIANDEATRCRLRRAGIKRAAHLSVECFCSWVMRRESLWKKLWSLPLASNAPAPLNLIELVCKPPFLPPKITRCCWICFFFLLILLCEISVCMSLNTLKIIHGASLLLSRYVSNAIHNLPSRFEQQHGSLKH